MLEGQELDAALKDDAKVSSEQKHGAPSPEAVAHAGIAKHDNVHAIHPLQDGAQLKADAPAGSPNLSPAQQAAQTEQVSFASFTLQTDAQTIVTSKAITLSLMQIAHQYINEGIMQLPKPKAGKKAAKVTAAQDKAIKKALDVAQQVLSMACDADAIGTKPVQQARLTGQKLDAMTKPH